MHDGVGLDLAHGVAEDGAIKEVALEKLGPGINRLAMAFAQVVENRHLVALIKKLFNADAADVAGSAGHENGFHGSWEVSGMVRTSKNLVMPRQACPPAAAP